MIQSIFLPDIAEGEDKSSPFTNKIRKNYRHVKKWAKRTITNCFRIYDKEIRHYPFAIDYYAGRFCVQYFSQSRECSDPPAELIEEVENALDAVFGKERGKIFWRTRARRKETRQYEKRDETGDFFEVLEYGIRFKVNLQDYLDTGLFLDHREMRHYIHTIAKEKRVLNLFSYTCSFSVHAAMGGAFFTKSVDLSNTYTTWGKENFLLNSLSLKNNEIIREDCLKFLENEEKREGYDIVIIDPPTISRSKKMNQLFDIQIDYVKLIDLSLRLLSNEGVIYFSTNSRKFSFDPPRFPGCSVREISTKTHPIDFHDPKVHRCWKITNNSR